MYRKWIVLFSLLFLAGWAFPAFAYTPFLRDKQIRDMKEKVGQKEWAKKAYRALLREGDKWTKRSIDIPSEYGGWGHDYVCPKHGVPLIFDETSPHGHRCPRDDQLYTGDKLDASWRLRMHFRWSRALKDLAIAYALTQESRYASSGRAILLRYAELWPQYRNPRTKKGRGHLFWQVLDEGQWAPDIAWGYNLLYPTLSTSDRQTIEEKLLTPLYNIIQEEQMQRIHNHRAWENAAGALLGFAMNNPTWFKPAIEGPLGFREQVAKGILDDGLWFEGSPDYHFFALEALCTLAEVASNFGYDLRGDPKLKAMFEAPLALALPSGELPALNDSTLGRTLSYPDLYELAYCWYGDSLFAQHLQNIYQNKDRNGLRSLLYGKPELEKPTIPSPIPSANLTSSGVAILRRENTYVLLKYGPHGGGHGHFDKLHFILAQGPVWLSPDLGTTRYGLPIYEGWFKQTLSHNTILVDQKRQKEASGSLSAFRPSAPVPWMKASVDNAYPGVHLERSLYLGDNYLVIFDRIHSSQSHIYDWVYHHYGQLVFNLPFEPFPQPLGKNNGYEYLESLSHTVTKDLWRLTWKDHRYNVRLTMVGTPDTQVITAQGPGMPISERLPMVIARRKATQTEYVAVLEWYEEQPAVNSVRLLNNSIQVVMTGKTATVLLDNKN
ncbi:MAG: heparinase II/III family protein [Thermodesulfobacteriota bacterium]